MNMTMDPPEEETANTNGQIPLIDVDVAAGDIAYELVHRRWDQLKPSPNNVRGAITDASVRELANSIVARGLLQDLTIHADGEIIVGHRRHHAIGLAIREGDLPKTFKISCQVATNADGSRVDEGSVTIDRLVENLMREDLDPIEEAKAIESAVGFGYTQNALAQQIGVSPAHISKRLALLQLAPEIQTDVSAGKVSLEKAALLVKIPLEEQAKFYKVHGASQYAIDDYFAKQRKKDAERKVIEDLKALGHTVRTSTGRASDGMMWEEVQPARDRTPDRWNGSVPKTASLVVVKTESYATKPTIRFFKEVKKPAGIDELKSWEKPRPGATANEVKNAIARRRKEKREEAKREAVKEAEARALLALAEKISKADIQKVWFASVTAELLDATWMDGPTARAACEILKIKPEPGKELSAIKAVLNDPKVAQAKKDRVVVVVETLGSGWAFKRALLAHANFDPDKVEVDESEETEVSDEEAAAIEDQLQQAADEEAELDVDDDGDDVRYEGTEPPEFDG